MIPNVRLPGREKRLCLLLALLSALAVLGWQELVIQYRYDGNQTGLFCTGEKFAVPPPLRAGTYTWKESTGYDGQFYRYVAHDPFFQKGFAAFVDDARHRYGRILVPLIARAMAAGRDEWIDRAFQFTVVAFGALGVYWTCSYLLLGGFTPWWGAPVFLLVPATLTSADRLLVDGPLCALFAGYLYYERRDRWKAVYVLAALAPLVRETGALLLAGVVASAVFARNWKRAAAFATAAIPAVLWALFVASHTAPSMAAHIVDKPVVGLFLRLFSLRQDYAGVNASLFPVLQTVDILAMVGFIACLLLAGLWLLGLYRKEGWTPVGITMGGFLALGLTLGNQTHLMAAYGYARPVSPLLLWVVLQAVLTRRFAALVPAMCVSVAVGMYLAYNTFLALSGLLQ